MHFGEHLMIDGYGGSFEKLESKDEVLAFLDKLPGELGMTKITEPVVKRYDGNAFKDPGGWSGYVMIAESHLSIHTFSKRGFLTADFYTCKNGLDKEKVIAYLKEHFDLNDVEVNFVNRGTRYPDDNIY